MARFCNIEYILAKFGKLQLCVVNIIPHFVFFVDAVASPITYQPDWVSECVQFLYQMLSHLRGLRACCSLNEGVHCLRCNYAIIMKE